MVKIILEKCDIEKLIKDKYPKCTIVSGLTEMEIIIKMDELFEHQTVPDRHIPTISNTKPQQQPEKKEVLLRDGTIDAKASGLTLENKGVPKRRLSGIL